MGGMTTPYFQDENATLYHGDSLEILPTLDVKPDVLLTDPPYFKVKQEEWDNQWDKASEFLGWMGEWLDHAKPLLTPQASVWVFASPVMTSSVERLVGERFRVLNSIRWTKEQGGHKKTQLSAMRSFIAAWEGIVFAEQDVDQYAGASEILRRSIFAPLGQRFQQGRERASLSTKDVAHHFPSKSGGSTGVVSNWENGDYIPSGEQYAILCELYGWDAASYGEVLKQVSELRARYESAREMIVDMRRPFTITDRALSSDVWTFPTVSHYPGKHPCEKPQSMLRHMVETSSRPGELILDPFAGSGSTLLAASHAGRRSVGIEKDERWCEHAANRLSQGTLEIFGEAA